MRPSIFTTDRTRLRRWIPRGYSPVRHLAGMYGVGLAAMAWLVAGALPAMRPAHALIVPAVAFVGTLLEYIAHRWIMHVRRAWLPLAWDAHAGRHHHYYRADAPTWEQVGDVWLILFSPIDVVILCALLAGPFALARLALAPDVWALTVATCIGHFLAYEGCHLACHLPEGHPLLRARPLAAMRARHLRHHVLGDTHANYGVTTALWDRAFRTARA